MNYSKYKRVHEKTEFKGKNIKRDKEDFYVIKWNYQTTNVYAPHNTALKHAEQTREIEGAGKDAAPVRDFIEPRRKDQ